MQYVYESIQPGVFNFTIPGKDQTVTLFKGSKVTLEQKLTGGYLRVLKLVEEINGEVKETPKKTQSTKVTTNKPKAKVADKITKVEEVVETPIEQVEVKIEDTIVEKSEEKPAPKRRGRRKKAE